VGQRGAALDALVERYVTERVATAMTTRGTAKQQRLTLRQFATSFGGRDVAKMGEADVIRWFGSTGSLKPSSRRAKLSIVKGFCRWLVKHGYVRRDPSVDLRSPRQPRTVPKVFEGDSVAVLLAGCPDARGVLVVLLMVQMGLRCAEVAKLELGDIDNRMASIQGKGGHQRMVPVTAEVRAALTAYLMERGGHAGPLVQNYHHPSQGLAPITISMMVSAWCRATGVKRFAGDGISSHGLRRTCASDLAERDVSLLDIAEALGHVDVATTHKHYIRHRAGRLAGAMEGRWYGRQRVGETG